MASWLSTTDNYSLLAIPGYYLLALAPHAYAIAIASGGRPATQWDNANPRAGSLKSALQAKLSPAAYNRYERAEAAHYNALESFPLFVAAVLVGNYAKLPVAELNSFVVGFTALRALYNVIYVGIGGKGPITFLRSAVWFAMVGWALRVLRVAGLKAL